MGGGGLEDSVAAAGCAGVRSLLCMCLLTKTHSSLMLTPAALPKPGGSLSHRAGQWIKHQCTVKHRDTQQLQYKPPLYRDVLDWLEQYAFIKWKTKMRRWCLKIAECFCMLCYGNELLRLTRVIAVHRPGATHANLLNVNDKKITCECINDYKWCVTLPGKECMKELLSEWKRLPNIKVTIFQGCELHYCQQVGRAGSRGRHTSISNQLRECFNY